MTWKLRSDLITDYADNLTGAITGTQHRNFATSAQINRVRSVTAGALTLDATDDECIFADASSGTIDITLANVGSAMHRAYEVVKVDSSGSLVNLIGTLSGSTSYFLGTQWHSVRFRSDGTLYAVTGVYQP